MSVEQMTAGTHFLRSTREKVQAFGRCKLGSGAVVRYLEF
jgi:hypothetical protein